MIHHNRPLESVQTVNAIEKLRDMILESDAIVVGAGAGLSTSAGYTYAGERFREHFQDFIDRYHFEDMYSAGFYPFQTLEEKWAFWSRYIYINRYVDPPKPVYPDLLSLVRDKDYFVLTTNVDHCFQRAGFEKERLFYTQGDFGLWQCSVPCHNQTYDNEKTVREMVRRQADRRVPTELVPMCPRCGEPMSMNLRSDETFVQDDGWDRAAERYANYIRTHQGVKTLFLELGIGMNTPGIIKFNFWRLTNEYRDAKYACLNLNGASAPERIRSKSICINGDIGEVLARLKGFICPV